MPGAMFASCDELLDYYVSNALDQVGPYGLGLDHGQEDIMFAEDGADASGAEAAQPYSTTNVQEVGVLEPDLVQTNGTSIFTVADGQLKVVDAASASLRSSTALDEHLLPGETKLLLDADTLVVIVSAPTSPSTTIIQVDVSDPVAPQILGSHTISGQYESARMVQGTVRLVTSAEPTLRFQYPDSDSWWDRRRATTANREIITNSTLSQWVPGSVADCEETVRPAQFSGFGTVAVTTMQAANPAEASSSSVALVASPGTIYASTDQLVVAGSEWQSEANDYATNLHTFDVGGTAPAEYAASGQVRGRIVDQFALSESEGIIRVATTSEGQWDGPASSSTLFTLARDGADLTVLGSVEDLGVTEEIKSVRYLSPDLAAVVTFRQTDPLYLIDTSEPADPVVRGELKIDGYSAYLHPIGDDHLLGIGQDADPSTGIEQGLQASLFDISNLANPELVDQLMWPGASSLAESDHHAFTYWPQTGQAFLPTWTYTPMVDPLAEESAYPVMSTGVSFTIEGESLIEGAPLGTSAHQEGIERTMVIGDTLWTVTANGLNHYQLDTLRPLGSVNW